MNSPVITLTLQQIIDLANFAGLTIMGSEGSDAYESDTEFTIRECPPSGIKNEGEPSDPDSVSHYEFIAYCTECPDEGCVGLGPEIAALPAAAPINPAETDSKLIGGSAQGGEPADWEGWEEWRNRACDELRELYLRVAAAPTTSEVIVRGPSSQAPMWYFTADWNGEHYVTRDPIGPATTWQAPEDGVALIAAERQRQITAEGWTHQHDEQEHDSEQLAAAAACYAAPQWCGLRGVQAPPNLWPWNAKWWKPGDRIRELTKAGALIAAEIDRLQRATPPASTQGDGT